MIPKLNFVLMLLVACMLAVLGSTNGQTIQVPNGMTLIRNKNAFMADKGLIALFASDCINKQYQQPTRQSQSIETVIELVERLEDVLANTTDPILSKLNAPENVARLLLHRFHLDDVDFETMIQYQHSEKIAIIDTQIVDKMQIVDNDYYFPDNIYSNDELCTLLYMFSHIFLNNSRVNTNNRLFKRAVYNLNRGSAPSQSPFLPSDNVNPIQEKGVVSFRDDKTEAIAISRVFYGIIGGLSTNFKLSAKQILNDMNYKNVQIDLVIKDPILAITLGSLMGTSSFFEPNTKFDQKLVYGVSGKWQNNTCNTYYAIDTSVSNVRDLGKSNRGSFAQIRGALDGYIIGNNLKNLEEKPSKLSTILRSYYSKSRSNNNNKYGVSYCDRGNNKPDKSLLVDVATTYKEIYNFFANQEGFTWKYDTFSGLLDQAANTNNEICSSKPGGSLDKNSPCETPSDLIFVIDPKSETLNQTVGIVSDILSKINKIGRYAGKVSVFVNSNARNSIELPNGPGGWPLPALIFNSSNVGSVMCQFNLENSMSPQINLGKYLHSVNQTVFNYKSWSPRFFSGVPSKNVILIDQGTLQMATGGTDRDEYNTYQDWFRHYNQDILLLVAANNQTNFKDVVRQEANLVSTSQAKIGTAFETKICDNPAALTYNQCYETPSQDFVHEGFITPGYRQNWAMYPEYFLKSRQIQFKIKAVGGSLKYCYDREFPPEKPDYCKDLQENAEEMIEIWNPCHHESLQSCRPIYFTFWGKEKSSICKDPECQTLDQIKFAISHTGIACNSAAKLGSFFLLPIVAIITILLYLI